MPRLNRNGEYLTGVGGGGGNLHIGLGSDTYGNVAPIGLSLRPVIGAKNGAGDSGEGSGWFWKDDDTIAGQFCGDPTDRGWGYNGCSVWTYNIRTGALGGPFGPGANNGKGRGGTAAWWLGNYGQIEKFLGVYSTTGFHNAAGAIADVYANGDILALKDYQQQTLGFDVARGAQVIRSIATLGQIQSAFARGSIALWLDFGTSPPSLRADGAPAPVSIPAWNHPGPFAADKNGRLWILDSQEGLLLRAWDVPIGRWLSRDGFNFWGDIITHGNGFRVVSSINQGEGPGSTRVFDVDPLTGDYTLNGTAGNAELIDLNTNAPAVYPTVPPAQTFTTDRVIGPSNDADLFPLAVAGFALVGVYLLRDKF